MSLRHQLKLATAAEHHSLEERLALTSESVSLDDYVQYLVCTYRCYAAVEPVLAGNAQLTARGLYAKSCIRLDALAADLRYFGRRTFPDASPFAYVPAQAAFPESIGCAYVLEGASLGGVVLSRHFERRFGVSRLKGGSFVQGDGAATASRWAHFVRALDDLDFSERERTACIDAACATFRGIEASFVAAGWTMRLILPARSRRNANCMPLFDLPSNDTTSTPTRSCDR